MNTHDITISKARKAAKTLSAQSGISHQQALDRLAREAGHGTWSAWLSADEGEAPGIPAATAASVLLHAGWRVAPKGDNWFVSQRSHGGEASAILNGSAIDDPVVAEAVKSGMADPTVAAFATRTAVMTASPPLRKSDKDVFLTLDMQDYHFEATLSADGPYIQCYDRKAFSRDLANGYVALGHCLQFYVITEDQRGNNNKYNSRNPSLGGIGPWVCKYSTREPRIHLARLNCAEIDLFLRTFGISAGPTGRDNYPFRGSTAWKALVEWVVAHPRLAKNWSKAGSYVGDWYGDALEQIGRRVA